MRPHLTGRNRMVERRRRAGLLRRSLMALEPFAEDLRRLWRLCTPVPSSIKALVSAVIFCVALVPLLFVPSVIATSAMVLNPCAAEIVWRVAHYEVGKEMHMQLEEALAYLTAWGSTFFSSLDFVRVLHEAGGQVEADDLFNGNDFDE